MPLDLSLPHHAAAAAAFNGGDSAFSGKASATAGLAITVARSIFIGAGAGGGAVFI
jgi:hypothetical protein